mmetsp:Transcript_67369/g.140371  ORF Transcript_67369/g.140371 Transcript_67369/m.140371 type:complete len:279 (+) Transcript_67369:98-934(+)|eukprot:CAMPEP_0181322922 /NCGR_PEP_ID=MMETSP1101-20121128/19492_1 /TAXON_ID=46948 /ORGANISM="Rhodomonas abbreviata, Strain Caron Lab Isolate" /LENGTH=278 /DNA_ID=CAMNT_0023430879 /DNA_START=96 /DNA_END=932 /DNA_ORIENTATION=-
MAGIKKEVIELDEWNRRLARAKVSKEDLDRLVMNFLIIEGYKDTAENFSREATIDPGVDLSAISDRMQIRAALHSGDVDTAIERVNDLNPEILETNTGLLFHLQQQRLIEMIRQGQVKEALEFVQDELPSLCEENSAFLGELESTLALLAFETIPCDGIPPAVSDPDVPIPPPELLELLEPLHRHKTASELNAAILASQAQEKESKLPMLLKMLVWAQDQLSRHARFPRIDSLVKARPRAPPPEAMPDETEESALGASVAIDVSGAERMAADRMTLSP